MTIKSNSKYKSFSRFIHCGLSMTDAVNEGFVTFQRVEKQQAVRQVDGKTTHQTSSTKVYTDQNENDLLPINATFCMHDCNKLVTSYSYFSIYCIVLMYIRTVYEYNYEYLLLFIIL